MSKVGMTKKVKKVKGKTRGRENKNSELGYN